MLPWLTFIPLSQSIKISKSLPILPEFAKPTVRLAAMQLTTAANCGGLMRKETKLFGEKETPNIQGDSVQHHNAWIKGSILHNSDSFQVSFAQSQYVGWDENSNELSFFYGYTYMPAIDELTGKRIQNDIKLWETENPIVLDYNPQAKILSAHEGEGFTINNGIGMTNMWESFGYMTFSQSGKVFVAKIPWTTTEIDMTFKVVDEEEKKCQVGNGHIPVRSRTWKGKPSTTSIRE